MNCRVAKKHIMPYIEGMLDEATRLQFEQHLTSCESCREECEAISRMQRVLKNVAPEPLEPVSDLWARVSAQIQPEQPTKATRQWWKTTPAIGAVAMLLLGIAIIPKYYQSSRQMIVATSSSSNKMLAAPGVKGMPGMPGMGGQVPIADPASSGKGMGMSKENKTIVPTLRIKKSKPAASVIIAKVPFADNYTKIQRDALTIKEETRSKESEVKLSVTTPTLDPSILSKTRSEAANGSLRMAKAAPLTMYSDLQKDDTNNRLNTVTPPSSNNNLMDMKLESPQTFAEVAKAAPENIHAMPGGPGQTATGDVASPTAAAPAMGTAGMPGMPAPAADKANANLFSSSAKASKVSDAITQTPPSPYGMIAVLEFQVKAGKNEAAISSADKLHSMQKVDQKTWYRLGEIEEKLGRKFRALEAYRKSTDGPDKDIARKASNQIKRLTRTINHN